MSVAGVSDSCSPEIAIGITAQEFLALELDAYPSENWTKAIDALKTRIEKRYLNPLKSLYNMNGSDHTFGFIILTAAFALVETLESFRQGIKNHKNKSTGLFKDGLLGLKIVDLDVSRELIESEKTVVYEAGRCALLHSGGTDKITIGITGDILVKLQDGRYKINRDKFVGWIEQKFNEYIEELKVADRDDMRGKFKTKMAYICNNA